MKHRKSQRGFSLIEMMIVLALIGIIAGIAVPGYRTYTQKVNLKSAAREISSDIFTLKARASSENRFYKIAFDTSAGTYSLQQGDSAGSVYSTLSTKALSNFASDLSFSSTTFSSDEIIFNPRGTCSQGNIILVNSNSNQGVIAITMTGRTYVSYPQ